MKNITTFRELRVVIDLLMKEMEAIFSIKFNKLANPVYFETKEINNYFKSVRKALFNPKLKIEKHLKMYFEFMVTHLDQKIIVFNQA